MDINSWNHRSSDLERLECPYDADKCTNAREEHYNGFLVLVNKRVHLGPHSPVHLVVLNLLHDADVAGPKGQVLKAGEELERLLVGEPSSSLQEMLCSQLVHVLLPIDEHGEEEEEVGSHRRILILDVIKI